VEFTLDPLAEYLAALHVVEWCGENEDRWRRFLSKGDQIANAPRAISSLPMAVLDSCAARRREVKIPDSVIAKLEARCRSAGLDLAA
jgi:hypothetical protein